MSASSQRARERAVSDLLQLICDELVRDAAAHTILLYGSRADDTANQFSDYDIAAFASVPVMKRDTRVVHGQFLDLFLHPEGVLHCPAEEHLTLRGSKVLLERGTEATQFLQRLDALFRKGPAPLSSDEIEARCNWARKMALRMRRPDIEGDFRRVWLLTALLEDYFRIRGMWYQGPKKSFQHLLVSDPETYRAFARALAPEASFQSIDRAVRRVVNIDEPAKAIAEGDEP
jgi:predicted nucleotidyltransferase